MNGVKTGLGVTPGGRIIGTDSALSRNIRQCFCLPCHGRLILQTDVQGAWFEHDLYTLSEQQKAACVMLDPGKSHPYIEDMEMFLPPLPVVLEWHCMICEQFSREREFYGARDTGVYCRTICTKSAYSYQPDLLQGCGGVSTQSEMPDLFRTFKGIGTRTLSGIPCPPRLRHKGATPDIRSPAYLNKARGTDCILWYEIVP